MNKELLKNIDAIDKLMEQASKHLRVAKEMITQLSNWEETGEMVDECNIAQIREVLGWASRRFSLGADCLKVVYEGMERNSNAST